MKLHLPKVLLTAVIAASACCQQVLGAVEGTVETYTVTGNNDGAITQYTAEDTITFNKENGHLYMAPAGQPKEITIAAKTVITNLKLTDGSGDTTYYFTNTVSGTGEFSFTATSTCKNQQYKFTGDMSDYSGAMKLVKDDRASAFIFEGNNTGTGTITVTGTNRVDVIGATILNSSIDVSTLSILKTDENITTTVGRLAAEGLPAISTSITARDLNIAEGATLKFLKGSLTVNSSLSNSGSLIFGEESKLVVSSLALFTPTEAGDIDYSQSGKQEIDTTYSLGNITGLNKVYVGSGDESAAVDVLEGKATGVATAYVVTDSITIGGDASVPDLENVEFFAVSEGGTLNIAGNTTSMTSSEILQTTVSEALGKGTIVLSTTADIAAGQSTVFEGSLKIATGGTLNFGKVKGAIADMSSFSSVVFDGGTMNYNAAGSTLKNVTVTSNGGNLYMPDFINLDENPSAVIFDGDTTISGNFTFLTEYKSLLTIKHLTGGGTFKISTDTANNRSDGGARVTIQSMSGFTGTLDLVAEPSNTNKVMVNATLDAGYTLNDTQIAKNNDKCEVTLTGAGTYNLGNATTMKAALSDSWKGKVSMSGTTLDNANLNTYGNASSTVELSNMSGTLSAGTVATNISLVPGDNTPGFKVTSTTGKEIVFTRAVSSTSENGNFVVQATNTTAEEFAADTYKFQGDVSSWKGKFISATDANVTFEGNATTIANAIIATGGTLNATIGGENAATVSGEINDKKWENQDGTLNLHITNTSAEGVTFTNSVSVDSTTVAAGSKAIFTGTSNLGTLTLASGLSETVAAVTTSGALTLGSISLDLTDYSVGNYTLVSATGDGSIIWDATAVNALSYTGTLGEGLEANVDFGSDNKTLQLTISEMVTPENPSITTTLPTSVTDVLGYENGMLTLKVAGLLTENTMAVVDILGDPSTDDLMKQVLDLVGETKTVAITLVGTEGGELVADAFDKVVFVNEKGEGYYGESVMVGGHVMYNVDRIPEPASATLSLAALMMLCARRRRRA